MILSSRRKLLFSGILLAILVVVLEIAAGVTDYFISRRGWMAYFPRFDRHKALEVLRDRNPHTGWGPTPIVDGRATRLTPNPNPSLPDPLKARVSVYGDSFTLGASAEVSYPYFISEQLHVPVANYGVGGFGSDQALMLFESQVALDPAPVVILGHLTENLLRNVNQYRNLLYPGAEYVFKPRYILQHEQLVYVPNPIGTVEDFDRAAQDPAAVLQHEAFLNRPRAEFPFTLSLARWAFYDYHVRAKLKKLPRHYEFYNPSHPAQGLQLTAAILQRFAELAREHHKIPYLVTIPTCDDLRVGREDGTWFDQPLVDRVRSKGWSVIHGGPALLGKINGMPVEEIYDSCNGHLNGKGYRLLSEAISDGIRASVTPDSGV